MSRTTEVLLYAELLANIRQISVIAQLPSGSLGTTRAELSKAGTTFTLFHNGKPISLDLPGTIASPIQLQPSPIGKKELSWRLPLADEKTQASHVDFSDTVVAPWSAKGLSASTQISCRSCRSVIVPTGTVTLWKDLPSENWAEMMDFWHCHKPDHKHGTKNDKGEDLTEKKGYGANSRFVADEGRGFVDLTYFLLNPRDCPGIATTSESSNLGCSTCSSPLGIYDTPRSSNRLYKWSLSLTFTSNSSISSPPLSHFLTAHLLSQIAAQAVSKFVLYSNTTTTTTNKNKNNSSIPILYIWVFAPRLTISFSQPTSTPQSPTSTLTPTTKMPVSKIFYKSITPQEKETLTDDTKIITAVEEVILESDVIQEVDRVLKESTKRLPESAAVFKDWSVGFLERFC